MTERQCSTPAFIYLIASAQRRKTAGGFRLVACGRHRGKASMLADKKTFLRTLFEFDCFRDGVIGERHGESI